MLKPLTFLAACAALPVAAQDARPADGPGARDLGATLDTFTQTDGKALYMTACSGCHGRDGGGAYGAAQYPALAVNARLGTLRYPVNLVIEGNGAMPAFGDWLSDAQVAAVVTYLRTNLGNDYPTSVTAQDVARLRRDFAELDGG